jgi:hypothetical protein
MSERGHMLVTKTHVYKFIDPDGSIARQLRGGKQIEDFRDKLLGEETAEGNIFLNEGISFIWQAITGATGLTYFTGTNTYIGVGDGTSPEDPTQTGLQGTNKTYQQVDTGYPQISANTIKFRATFGPDVANHAWKEWTVANGNSDSAVNLNRKVQDMGTKASGTTWTIEVTLLLS